MFMDRVEQDFRPEGVTYVVAHARDRKVIRDALAQVDDMREKADDIRSKLEESEHFQIDAADVPFVVRIVGSYAHDLGHERSTGTTRKRAERLIGAMVVASAGDYNSLLVLDQ
jgi:hypothetical protein